MLFNGGMTSLLIAAALASNLQAYALRLTPGQDLKPSLMAFAKAQHLQAACILSAVGSLNEAHIRFADQPQPSLVPGKLEITSLGGTLTADGGHLHLTVADQQGHAFGGHLADGCPIYTTAEIVIGELTGLRFERRPDPATTFLELFIGPRPVPGKGF
jgi:predicted DNA-binding protein with PD1-like motif